MKKRTLISFALLLTLAMALTGCGKEVENVVCEDIPEVSVEETTSVSEEEASPVSVPEVSISEEVVEEPIEEPIEEPEVITFEKVVITSEEDVIENNTYSAKDFYAEFLGDKGISKGWYYYYVESLDSGLAGTKYQANLGNYACTVTFNVTNNTDSEVMLTDHITAKFVSGKSGEYIPFIYYQNPEQYDQNGIAVNSTVTVPLKSQEERHIQFMTDIPNSEFSDVDLTLYIYYDGVEIMEVICNDLMVEAY